ncbi:MAG: class I SAM-dependent methyltransferase [Planctomycetes bacterium]|nr:class I SAM-dependent methyltransferase [Planctomycetota bacterium]
MDNVTKTYNDFWSSELKDSRKQRNKSWFRRKRYKWLSYVFPRLALKRGFAKKYHQGVVSVAEGFFCDLGCGLGACVGLYAASSGFSAVGLDASLNALSFARSEKERLHFDQIHFIAGNLFDTPFKNDYFDTVYLGQVLEHVENEEEVVKEAVRILKPGGKLIITVPKEDLLPSPYHVRTYTAKDLESLLSPYAQGKIQFYPFDMRRFAVSLKVVKNKSVKDKTGKQP